jgi:hypothetical protein
MIDSLDGKYAKVATFFSEDPKKVLSDELFSKIDSVWSCYKRVNNLNTHRTKRQFKD